MSTERQRVTLFAAWVGGQLKTIQTQIAGVPAGSTIQTWINNAVAASEQKILGTATAAMDTFGEVQAALANEDSVVAGLTTAIGQAVKYVAQPLTVAQTAQARANIDAASLSLDLGATDTDYVAVATTAMT